jgi:hypothetical protein
MQYDYELYRGLRERFLLNRTDFAAASAAIRNEKEQKPKTEAERMIKRGVGKHNSLR